MHRHAARGAGGEATPGCGPVEFVECVAGLVGNAHHGRGEVVFAVAGGDADIVGRAAAEGVGADIEAATVKVETEELHDIEAQLPLRVDGEGAGRLLTGRLRGLALDDLADHRRQLLTQRRKDLCDAGRPHARLELVDQGIVGGQSEGLRLGGGDLSNKAQDLGERGREEIETVLRAGLGPDLVAAGAGAGERLDQGGLDGGGVGIEPAHLGQVHLVVRVGGRVALGLVQPVADAGVGEGLVRNRVERGDRLSAGLGSPFWHDGEHVPAEDAAGIANGGDLLEAGVELFVGGVCSGHDSPRVEHRRRAMDNPSRGKRERDETGAQNPDEPPAHR